MIKVLLVDDHVLVRTGIKLSLQSIADIQIVGEAGDGEEAMQLARQSKPDLVLMDVNMPRIGGLEATHKLLRLNPNVKILIITAYADNLFPKRFLQAGVAGYLTKDASAEEMLQAIKAISLGKKYISPAIASQLALAQVNKTQESLFSELSTRELQIATMIVRGIAPRLIAEQLHLSPKTINSYRYRIFNKLAIHSDVELTILGIQNGLLETGTINL